MAKSKRCATSVAIRKIHGRFGATTLIVDVGGDGLFCVTVGYGHRDSHPLGFRRSFTQHGCSSIGVGIREAARFLLERAELVGNEAEEELNCHPAHQGFLSEAEMTWISDRLGVPILEAEFSAVFNALTECRAGSAAPLPTYKMLRNTWDLAGVNPVARRWATANGIE